MVLGVSMKILIIVPAYNESENIVNVISSLKNQNNLWDVLIINDYSKDNTSELAKSTNNAYVIDLLANLGIGGGVQTGFKFAKKYNYDICLQFDGDGQHIASEIPKLLNPIINNSADVVIGSRFCEKRDNFKSTFARRIGIKIFEILNSILIGQKITDNTSGFRAYNKAAFHFLSEFYPSDYPEPEAVILLGKNGFRISEVFTKMQERQGGKSSIFGLKSIYYIIKVIFAIFMTAIRRKIIKRK